MLFFIIHFSQNLAWVIYTHVYILYWHLAIELVHCHYFHSFTTMGITLNGSSFDCGFEYSNLIWFFPSKSEII